LSLLRRKSPIDGFTVIFDHQRTNQHSCPAWQIMRHRFLTMSYRRFKVRTIYCYVSENEKGNPPQSRGRGAAHHATPNRSTTRDQNIFSIVDWKSFLSDLDVTLTKLNENNPSSAQFSSPDISVCTKSTRRSKPTPCRPSAPHPANTRMAPPPPRPPPTRMGRHQTTARSSLRN
jgi:hypothetical protein